MRKNRFVRTSAFLAVAIVAMARTASAATISPSPENLFFQVGPGYSDDVANEKEGRGVAVSGDWMFLGGPFHSPSGLVEVYHRTPQDYWAFYEEIDSPSGQSGDGFGAVIAFDGNTLLVGAPFVTVNGNVVGAAYVFTYSAQSSPSLPFGTFAQPVLLNSPSATNYAAFGYAVALSGDTAAVGTPNATHTVLAGRGLQSYTDAGLVALYQRNSGGANAWGNTATLYGETNTNTYFGAAVALAGSELVIGAPGSTVTPAGQSTVNSGRAYFYTVNSDGSATYIYYVGTATPAAGRKFGAAAAIAGSLVAVGAPATVGSNLASVDIFQLDSGGVPHYLSQINSVYSGAYPNDPFGTSLAISGTRILVGTPNQRDVGMTLFDNVVGESNSDWYAAFNFYESSTRTSLTNASSGYAVAFDGITAVAGAPTAQYDSYPNAGAAFVFTSDAIFRNGFDNATSF